MQYSRSVTVLTQANQSIDNSKKKSKSTTRNYYRRKLINGEWKIIYMYYSQHL